MRVVLHGKDSDGPAGRSFPPRSRPSTVAVRGRDNLSNKNLYDHEKSIIRDCGGGLSELPLQDLRLRRCRSVGQNQMFPAEARCRVYGSFACVADRICTGNRNLPYAGDGIMRKWVDRETFDELLISNRDEGRCEIDVAMPRLGGRASDRAGCFPALRHCL